MKSLVIFFSFLFLSFSLFADVTKPFETRIHSHLKISGTPCLSRTCPNDSWVITIDESYCPERDAEGRDICQYKIPAVVLKAHLVKADIISITTITYYEIEIISEVEDEVRDLLSNYMVRFDLNGKTKVVSKK